MREEAALEAEVSTMSNWLMRCEWLCQCDFHVNWSRSLVVAGYTPTSLVEMRTQDIHNLGNELCMLPGHTVKLARYAQVCRMGVPATYLTLRLHAAYLTQTYLT